MTVVISNHGGHCCGSKHIHTFRNDTNPAQDVRELKRILVDITNSGKNNQLVEVILSNKQATEKPVLIQTLADLGFTLADAWQGNHGTPVWRFSRSGRRLALNSQTFNWQGMTMHGNLAGDLSPIVGRASALNQRHVDGQPENAPARQTRAIRVGDTVRVINRRLDDYNMAYDVLEIIEDYWGVSSVSLEGRQNRLKISSVELVTPVAEPTLVHTSYHNYFRRTDTRGAGWETLEEAVNISPRCRRRDRKEVYSDGSVVWVENVNE